jgi:dienelactone hydrolase
MHYSIMYSCRWALGALNRVFHIKPLAFWRRARTGLVALLLLALCPAFAAAAEPAFRPGVYVGGIGRPPQFVFTRLEVKSADSGALSATMTQPVDRVGEFAVENLRADASRLQFSSGGDAFDLRRTETGYAGSARDAKGAVRPVSLVLRDWAAAERLEAYQGVYDLGGGRTIALGLGNQKSGFFYLKRPSELTGVAIGVSPVEFIAGDCFYCVDPVRLRFKVVFDKAGKVSGMMVQESGKETLAPRLDLYREERVTFTNPSGIQLAGSLFLPLGPGPHPAVVIGHGSGAQSRHGFYARIRFMADAYARRGIAVLAYDKQGVGDSKGDWETAGLDVLAEDVAAGLRYLKTRPEIDAKRLGVSGGSQAGLILPRAARLFPGVRFIQLQSGSPGLKVEEQERLRLLLQMRADGFPQSEIERAMRMRGLIDEWVKTGKGKDEMAAEWAKVEKEYWASYIDGLPSGDGAWLREAFKFDSAPDLIQFTGSLQVLYGGLDAITPTKQAKVMLEAALARSRIKDATITVVPGANHDYMLARTGGEKEIFNLSRFVPRYHDDVAEWAAQRFELPPR